MDDKQTNKKGEAKLIAEILSISTSDEQEKLLWLLQGVKVAAKVHEATDKRESA